MTDVHKIAPFFSGWEETLIWSCLQGCMGYALVDDHENPTAAQIVVGDFCFFAGTPSKELVEQAAAPILVPRNEKWGTLMESIWGNRVEKSLRYAIKKEPGIFNIEKLTGYANSLEGEFALKQFDREIYDYMMREEWSRDFCLQFADYSDYHKRGLGVAVTYQGVPVSGASSYTAYNGGIEIEIDTKPEFRRNGLASVCGARLILECLKRGLYPSWDAHNLHSAALAEKLGYHIDHPYIVYLKK